MCLGRFISENKLITNTVEHVLHDGNVLFFNPTFIQLLQSLLAEHFVWY